MDPLGGLISCLDRPMLGPSPWALGLSHPGTWTCLTLVSGDLSHPGPWACLPQGPGPVSPGTLGLSPSGPWSCLTLDSGPVSPLALVLSHPGL
jgi:hypothetical protein